MCYNRPINGGLVNETKTSLARKAGISLMHIWEYDWNDLVKQEIIKSQIRHKLGMSTRVYGRKTVVATPSKEEATQFEKNNHLQGHAASSYQYGLYYEGQLVALATFAKPRFSKEADFELIRYVTKRGTTVVGGMSKLIKAFIKDIPSGSHILTYADNDFALDKTSSVYSRAGFEYIRTTVPDYKWIKGGSVISRYSVQPKRLLKKYPDDFRKDNPSETEAEFMTRKGYVRVWGAGNDVYLLTV